MRLVEPFFAAGEHIAIDLPGARAVFTTRRGGVSRGRYATLNLGRFTDDDPVAVRRNRELLESQLGVRLVFGRQVHGSCVQRVEAAPDDCDPLTEADGQATAQPGLAPMVLTADCLPIAIAGGRAVAMLHAGWRGLAAGIIAGGAAAVRELGDDEPLAAAIGPGAGPCCYEVDDDVRAVFAPLGKGASHARNLDLKAIARDQLARAGVETVHDCGLCTICGEALPFYSHRRDGAGTGRQAGIAWLT